MRGAAAILGVALLVLLAPAAHAAVPTAALRAEPPNVGFGDPFVIEAVVRLGAATAVVLLDPSPFTALAGPTTSTRSDGGTTIVTVRQRVACLDRGCLPGDAVRSVRAGTVSVRSNGVVSPVSAKPALVRVAPRVAADVATKQDGGFRAAATPPRPTYALSPGVWTALLAGAAAVALLLAGALSWPDIRRRAARRRIAVDIDPFARAVRLLRESALRGVDDRRRAAGLVARLLRGHGDAGRSGTAATLAWARAEPAPGDAVGLADAVTVVDPGAPS